jgi:hypothetical protein
LAAPTSLSGSPNMPGGSCAVSGGGVIAAQAESVRQARIAMIRTDMAKLSSDCLRTGDAEPGFHLSDG